MDFLFSPEPVTLVLMVVSIGFAFQASLATAIFLKTLPWKRLFICYLIAAMLVPLILGAGSIGAEPWSAILYGSAFASTRIFIGCLIGTAPVALVLLVIDLWRGDSSTPQPDDGQQN